MITDRIRRHEVLLPINHNYNKSCDNIRLLCLNQNTTTSNTFFFVSHEKKPFARVIL